MFITLAPSVSGTCCRSRVFLRPARRPIATPVQGDVPWRRVLAGLAVLSWTLLSSAPARSLETLVVQIPLLQTSFSLRVSDLADQAGGLPGSSDFAQLDRATNGRLSRELRRLLATPLPIQTRSVVANALGTPLFAQVTLLASAVARIEGLPPDRDGRLLARALQAMPLDRPLTILSLLQALPGQTASIDLQEALEAVQRLQLQQRRGVLLASELPPVSSAAAGAAAGPLPTASRSISVSVPHRSTPLRLELVSPTQGGNRRLVLISHGLWDGPVSFEGWADLLASHGYTVILPYHPGSDSQQQQAMLSGKAAPPSPDELRQRPLDISALIDAVERGGIPGLAGVAADRVVVIGHSWGATTALQLAGASPSSSRLRQRCDDLHDPDRNLSWVLQCSFLGTADQASLADPRVIGIVAVSPPLNLLFDTGAARPMQARALLVSGTADWVVPSGPEAIDRFATPGRHGHQLVLVGGGDHFNLRAARGSAQAPLSPLLLAWTEAVFGAGAGARPAPGAAPLLSPQGWGSSTLPMVEASSRLDR